MLTVTAASGVGPNPLGSAESSCLVGGAWAGQASPGAFRAGFHLPTHWPDLGQPRLHLLPRPLIQLVGALLWAPAHDLGSRPQLRPHLGISACKSGQA